MSQMVASALFYDFLSWDESRHLEIFDVKSCWGYCWQHLIRGIIAFPRSFSRAARRDSKHSSQSIHFWM